MENELCQSVRSVGDGQQYIIINVNEQSTKTTRNTLRLASNREFQLEKNASPAVLLSTGLNTLFLLNEVAQAGTDQLNSANIVPSTKSYRYFPDAVFAIYIVSHFSLSSRQQM